MRTAALTGACVLLASLGASLVFKASAAAPQRYREVPAFSLTAQDGSPFTREALSGHVVIVDFIFTRCGGACPAMTTEMALLQAAAPADTRFVSFTVDPRFDTPEVLSRYARDHRAREGWWFVTGPPSSLYALATQGFSLMAMEVPEDQRKAGDDGPFLHSSKLVLLDAKGWIRGYYDSEDPVARRSLLRDAARLGPYGILPRVNASLNAASGILLLCGYLLIRSGRRSEHRNCMIGALLSSALFLTSYLDYHAHVGSVRYPGEGPLRTVYLAILASHTMLAIAIVPLVAVTVTRAARARFDAHRRIAKLTLPLWGYVSLTGVVVYWMLYQL
jgi:protein SCO1/2/putative membrane protein